MIKEIVLEINGQEVRMSPDEAKKLYASLHDIFGEKECQQLHSHWTWYPNTWYQPPTYYPTWSTTGTSANVPSTLTVTNSAAHRTI